MLSRPLSLVDDHGHIQIVYKIASDPENRTLVPNKKIFIYVCMYAPPQSITKTTGNALN